MIQERINKIQQKLEIYEAMLITEYSNRFYFTGFESSAGAVIITKATAYFLIDFRYFEKAKKTVTSCTVLLSQNIYEEINEILKKHSIKTLYTETDALSIEQFARFKKAFDNVLLSDDNAFARYIKAIRSIKSDKEIENIKGAQKFTDDTFSYILERIESGRTEREIMLDMEFYMRRLGSEGVAFDFIVVSGENSSLPHGVPTERKIHSGDFITMDFGAVYNSYRSDMTRTVAVGSISEEQAHVYDIVLQAQKEAINAIKQGVICKDIDRIARDIIYNKGYHGCFGHGLGHSVGIEIHESPCFNTRDETMLLPNTVMTVEPGIYIENKFGVRIEDMIVVTETGYLNLTNSLKELIVL